MTDDISYEATGKALDEQLTAIGDRLDAFEGDITDLQDTVDEDDEDHEHEQYLTKPDAIALINEHGASIPEDRLEAIDQELANIREAIGMVRGGVSSTIGPDVPDVESIDSPEEWEHSTPGWGAILTLSEPRQFRDCTIISNRAGKFTAELWEYDGDAGERVDHTDIEVISDGAHDVDLDLQAPEPGTYLLTRDYDRGKSTISLWRTPTDWDGWGDVDQSLTLHNSAHPDYGGEPLYWYYYYALEVLPYYPDGGEYGAAYGDDYGNGDG